MLKGVTILSMIVIAGAWFGNRFYIGLDPQDEKCLPWTVFLVDTADQSISQGDYFAYSARGMQPALENGVVALKQAAATSDMSVDVGLNETLIQGNEWVNGGIHLADRLPDAHAQDFVRSLRVPEGEIFAMGTEPVSYDSRYWGTVKQDQLVGQAYPLF